MQSSCLTFGLLNLEYFVTFTLYIYCLLELSIACEWLTSQVGVHTTTVKILEVQFDINAMFAYMVLKTLCSICENEDD